MYFNMPFYRKDFSPSPNPDFTWESVGGNQFVCAAGRATLRVFRYESGKPWWAECGNPTFESASWFWTAEQAMHWLEKEISEWFD